MSLDTQNQIACMRNRPSLGMISVRLFLLGVLVSLLGSLLFTALVFLLDAENKGILILLCFFLIFILYLSLVLLVIQKGLRDIPTFHVGILKYFDKLLEKKEDLSMGWQKYVNRFLPELFDGTVMEEGKWFIFPFIHNVHLLEIKQENVEIIVRNVSIIRKNGKTLESEGQVDVTINLTRVPMDYFENITSKNPAQELESAVDHAVRAIARDPNRGPQNITECLLMSEDFSKSIFMYFKNEPLENFEDPRVKEGYKNFTQDPDEYVRVSGTGYGVNLIKVVKIIPSDPKVQDALSGIVKEKLEKVAQTIQGQALGKTVQALYEGLLFPENFDSLPEDEKTRLRKIVSDKMQAIHENPKLLNENIKNVFINNEKITESKTFELSINSSSFSDEGLRGLGSGAGIIAAIAALTGGNKKGEKRS